jgi:flagellar motor switch/type III secretory pathway protein FliN
MAEPSPWLPPAPAGAVERILVAFVESWAIEWACASPRYRVTASETRPSRALSWQGRTDAAVAIDDEQLPALGQWVLGGAGDRDNLRDREILAALGQAALADMAMALLRASGAADATERLAERSAVPDGTSYHVTAADAWGLHISLSAAAEIRLRKNSAGRRRRPAFGRFSAAFAPERIRLGCHLGHAVLSAADLTGLAKGDLIVLDRGTADELPITVEGIVAAKGKAAIVTEAGQFSVRLNEAPTLAAGQN